MNIICLAQTNWDWCWTGKQHMLLRLARRGHKILYVDPSQDYSYREKSSNFSKEPVKKHAGLRQICDGLFVYSYPIDRSLHWRHKRFKYWRYPHHLRLAAKKLNLSDPIVLSILPSAEPFVDIFNPIASAYYAVDEMTAFGGIPEEERTQIRSQEERMIQRSDLTLAVSEKLKKRFEKLHPNTHLLPNGVDTQFYSPSRLKRITIHPMLKDLNGPVIGFIGQVDERINQELLIKMAKDHPQWNIILVGRKKKGVDFSQLENEPNITLTGYQHYENLPHFIKAFDVCMIPYRISELTHSCNPLKLYEYLATGRPVVSTPIAGIEFCKNVIYVADQPADFIEKVKLAVNETDPQARRDRLKVAKENDWEYPTDILGNLLQEITKNANRKKKSFIKPKNIHSSHIQIIHTFWDNYPTLKIKSLYLIFTIAGYAYYGLRVVSRFLSRKRPVTIRKILVNRQSRLGDMVIYLPTLKNLRKKYPHAKIVLNVNPSESIEKLLKDNRDIDEIRHFEFVELPGFRKFVPAFKLFIEGFDLIVSGGFHFVKDEAFLSGAPFRIGLYDGHPMQRWNRKVLIPDLTRHTAENNLDLLQAMAGKISLEDQIPELTVDEAKVQKASNELCRALGIDKEGSLITIHPGANKETRQWPKENFASLITKLLASHSEIKVVLTGIEKEKPITNFIQEQVPLPYRDRVMNAAGLTDVYSFLGLINKSKVFISNDTGTMHLARARGCRQLALFGPENSVRWGPFPLSQYPSVVLHKSTPCSPCLRVNCEHHYCLRSLKVADVWQELNNLLSAPESNGKNSVVRHRELKNWNQLEDEGFSIPNVTIALLHKDLNSNPANHNSVGIKQMMKNAENQTYPRINLIAHESLLKNTTDLGRIKGTIQGQVNLKNDKFLRSLNENSKGDFITFMTPGTHWYSWKIDDDVASLTRNPTAHLAASAHYPREPQKKTFCETINGITIRRSFLLSYLNQLDKNKSNGHLSFKELLKKEPVFRPFENHAL